MKKSLLILVALLTAVAAWAGEYTYDSQTGALTLVSGEFNKDNKWGSDVPISQVKSVIATSQVSFTGDCTQLFYGFSNCTSMDLNSVNTSAVTNMDRMFSGCSILYSLNLSSWNTANVTFMNSMFSACGELSSLNISSWDTGNVTNMGMMFNLCRSLTSLDISGWNTANVMYMNNMFYYCWSLTSLDLSGWDIRNVYNMLGMFMDCSSLKSLNLAGWEINNECYMPNMFQLCDQLTTIYVTTSWDVGSVSANATTNMFFGCEKLVGGCGTTFDSNYTDKTYARIDRGEEEPGYFTGLFSLSLPANVTAAPNPFCTLGGTGYFKAGTAVILTYNGEVPQGKMAVYSVNGTPIEGNTFPMPLDDVTVTVSFINLPTEVTVGDITFKMMKVDGNDDIATFYIGECEVTEALWQAVMGGDNPSNYQGDLADNLPVESISWNDCQAFLAKLKQMTKLDFRLPTSAEWLFAASGGNDTHGYTYSGSNTVDDVAWYSSNCSQKMTVGTKAPNELGIHDMSGNVYEIIQEATRVYGGGWHSPANKCKVGYGWTANEDFTDNDTGFRLALTNLEEISVIPGDVNGDGDVNVMDITALIDEIMNDGTNPRADVNGDGEINVMDITALIDIIMNS